MEGRVSRKLLLFSWDSEEGKVETMYREIPQNSFPVRIFIYLTHALERFLLCTELLFVQFWLCVWVRQLSLDVSVNKIAHLLIRVFFKHRCTFHPYETVFVWASSVLKFQSVKVGNNLGSAGDRIKSLNMSNMSVSCTLLSWYCFVICCT